MEKIQETQQVERYFVNRAFRKFFIPSFLSNTGLALGALADCLFVGNTLGTDGLAAISIGLPIYMLLNTISMTLATGGSIHYATCLGEGDAQEGNRIFMDILRFALGLYIVLCSLGPLFLPQLLQLLGAGPAGTPFYEVCRRYVRAQLLLSPLMYCQGPLYYFINSDNAPKLAAVSLVTSNLLDIFFNYIFVVRLGCGAEGSVYSTAIGAGVMVLLSCGHIIGKKGMLRFGLSPFRIQRVWRAAKVGFSTSVQYLYQFAVVLLCNRLLMWLDGALAVSIFTILYNLQDLVASIYDSMSMTMLPMVSTFLGEHNYRNILHTLRQAFAISLAISACIAAVLLLFPQQACSLFGLRGAEEWYQGVWAIRLFACSVVLCSVNMVFTYYYQAVNQERISFILVTLRSFLGFALLSLVLAPLGIRAFWWVYLLSEGLAFLWLLLRNHRRHNWTMLPADDHVFSACLANDIQQLGDTLLAAESYLEALEVEPSKCFFVTNTIEEVCSVIIQQGFRGETGYIQLTLVPLEAGELRLHIRDSAGAFNPFSLDTDNINLDQGQGLDALGLRMVKAKAKEFSYRQYAGFNTMVLRI